MIKSMTGYGKSVAELPGKKITVELKSLNSKNFNFIIKLPEIFRDLEAQIRNTVSKKLERGKIELSIRVEFNEPESTLKINRKLVQHYYSEFKDIFTEVTDKEISGNLVSAILKMPNIFQNKTEEANENEKESVLKSVNVAIKNLNDFRIQEGKSLEKDLVTNIKEIETLAQEVTLYEAERITGVRDRIQSRIDDFFKDSTIQDKNRFEQEIIYYIEKLDLNEEKVRLKNHCLYFIESLGEKAAPGRKLGFIAQEIGREINTLGSKANHAEIQKLAVKMKDSLEKIKEQTLNIL